MPTSRRSFMKVESDTVPNRTGQPSRRSSAALMSGQRADALKLSGGERRDRRRTEKSSEPRCPQHMNGVCGENNWRERGGGACACVCVWRGGDREKEREDGREGRGERGEHDGQEKGQK